MSYFRGKNEQQTVVKPKKIEIFKRFTVSKTYSFS